MIRAASQRVFRCFRRFERFVDRLTGRVGPLFVGLASVLIAICAFTFFDVIFPSTFLGPSTHPLVAVLALMFCIYLAINIVVHYRLACLVPPGSPLDPIAVLEAPPPPVTPVTLSGDQGLWKRLQACIPGRTTGSTRTERGRAEAIRAIKSGSQSKKPVNGNGSDRGPVKEKTREEEEREARSSARVCKKCPAVGVFGPDGHSGPAKPERAHHCRICGRCWLKFDHHCPWINQCVGLGNERYFLLFMVYLSFSCLLVSWWGWGSLMAAISFDAEWGHTSPRTFVLLTWVMTACMGLTVGIMATWQLLQIVRGETSVESSDNEYYRQVMKSRGQTFVNPYDLGRTRNLAQFFNVRPFSHRGWASILVPTRVPPASDGWNWEKRAGWERKTVEYAEELTDEEEEPDE